MRIDRLTNQLQNALADAQSLAVGRDHNQIEPAHVLLAMLDQQGGSVRPLLSQAGFDVNGLRNGLAKELEGFARVQNPTGDVHMSQELMRLFNLADKQAQKAGDKFIAGDYMREGIEFSETLHGHQAEVIGTDTLKAVHIKLEKRS